MTKVAVIRHSEADYPNDRLTEHGLEIASLGGERFGGYTKFVSSPKTRAIQTIQALGAKNPKIDSRVIEYEAPIKARTADEYILQVHYKNWKDLVVFGDNLLTAIKEYGLEDDTLIVSHNAVMSAALRILTGEIHPFQNLHGFEVEVSGQEIGDPRKI